MALRASRGRKRDRDQELINRRRSEILAAAAIVFSRQGYAKADVQAIADEVGVAKGTLYHYFGSKEQIFFAAVDEGMCELKDRLTLVYANSTDPIEAIAAGIYVYLHYFDSNKSIVELFIQERAYFADRDKPTYFIHRDANVGPWRELVALLIKEGRLQASSVDQIVDTIGALLYGSMFINYFSRRNQSVVSQAVDLVGVAFNGVLGREHSERWAPDKIREAIDGARRSLTGIQIAGQYQNRGLSSESVHRLAPPRK